MNQQTPLQKLKVFMMDESLSGMIVGVPIVSKIWDKIEELIPYEKQVIETAYNDGTNNDDFFGQVENPSEEYFKTKFSKK
jgi:hypothetical protein